MLTHECNTQGPALKGGYFPELQNVLISISECENRTAHAVYAYIRTNTGAYL